MSQTTRQQNNTDLPPLYSLTAMGIATFLGSALAAGYMLASNYAALGKRQLAQYVLAASLVFVVLLTLIPSQWITTVQAAIVLMLLQITTVLLVANKLQGAMFASYEELGGRYYSNWRAVVVGAIAAFVLMITSVLIFVLSGAPQPSP